MKQKKAVRRAFESLVSYMDYMSCAVTAILCVWILVDIFGRFLFSRPIPGTAELAGNVIVGVLFLGVTSVEMRREHIRSDLLLDRLKPKGREIVEIVSTLMGLTVFGFGIVSCWGDMMEAWRILEYDGEGSLHIPTYPFKTIVVIGCACMIVQLLINLKDSILFIVKRDKGGQKP